MPQAYSTQIEKLADPPSREPDENEGVADHI